MFKNHVREKREELGISQVRLSCVCGLANSLLSDIENGKRQPYPKARRDISQALSVAEGVLFPSEGSQGE